MTSVHTLVTVYAQCVFCPFRKLTPTLLLAGISAATAVILLVALLSIQALRQRTTSPFSLDQSSQDSFDKPAKLAVSAAISSSSAPSSSDSSTACEADPLMSGTPAMEQTSMLPTHERDSLPNTMYFTLQYVSSQLALHSMSHAMPPVTADQACSRIPAPLWQEVHIQAQDICIAQNAAGKDWLLGEGSSGKVLLMCFTSSGVVWQSCTSVPGFLCMCELICARKSKPCLTKCFRNRHACKHLSLSPPSIITPTYSHACKQLSPPSIVIGENTRIPACIAASYSLCWHGCSHSDSTILQ